MKICTTTFYRFQKISMAITTALIAVFLTGCTSAITISPSTTPITERDTYTKLGHASGSSSGFAILCIPFDPSEPSKSARDNAIKNGKGNALIEVTEEYNMLSFLVVTFNWTKVEGTAVTIEHSGEEIE